jgi:hypothetical protein
MRRKKPFRRKKPMRRKSAEVVQMFPMNDQTTTSQEPEPAYDVVQLTTEEVKNPAFKIGDRVKVVVQGWCDSGWSGRVTDVKGAVYIRIEYGPEAGYVYAHSNHDDLELIVEPPTEQPPIDEPQPVA